VLHTLLLLAAGFAACARSDVGPASPDLSPPRLQVVRCAPATPAPVLADDGVTFGGLTKAETLERNRSGPQPVVLGGAEAEISTAAVARVMRGRIDALRACYEQEIGKSLQAGVSLSLTFVISPDGIAIGVQATGPSKPFETCATRALESARFPRPRGGAVRVKVPLALHESPSRPPVPWTPYALDGSPVLQTDPMIARAAERALRRQLDRLGACFHGFTPTGSIRAMLEIDDSGMLRTARVGGLGDREVEACLRRALAGLVVPSPSLQPAELSCDLARGDAQRWRVDPADYAVIRATRAGVAHGTQTLAPSASEPEPLPGGRTYLVVLDADTPGTVLELALAWAFDGDATLLAVADAKGGPPAVIGVGRSTYALGEAHDSPGAQEVSLELYGDVIAACVAGDADTVPVAEAARLAQRLAAACRRRACAGTVTVAVEGGAAAAQLPPVLDALRRAGFARVLIGAGLGCARTQGRGPRG